MSKQSESDKRDFVTQVAEIMENNAPLLIEKKYDPAEKVAELKQQGSDAVQAEAKQTDADKVAKDATELANATLGLAYKNASAAVEIIAGLLGKNHNLVLELRKLRK